MTSNVGSEYMKAMSRIGFSTEGAKPRIEESDYREKTMEALKRSFRPEFLNRIDDVVIFSPLRKIDLEKIVDIQLALIRERLAARNITLQIDPTAREYLVHEGFSAEFGARPLKRLMQKVILDALADKIIRGEFKNGGKVKVGFKQNALVFMS